MNFSHKFFVDAGCIGVIDKEYLTSKGGENENIELNPEFDLDSGKYKIQFKCNNAWVEKVNKEVIVESRGKLIFGDLCYLFSNHNKWMDFLNETDYLKKSNEYFHVIDLGGDGEFKVKVKIDKL